MVITDTLAAFLKATADPLRLEVLQVLGHSSFGVLELVDILAVKQSGMSHHLKVLAQGGLVEKRREGNSIFYRRRLPQPGSVTSELHEALLTQLDLAPLVAPLAARLDQVQAQRAAQSKAFFARHGGALAGQQELIADYPQYAEQAFELLARLAQGGTVLEVGPGEGQFLALLARQFDRVIGLDNSEVVLEQARRAVAGQDRVQLLLGEWPQDQASLPAVDAMVFNMVLHHLPSPSAALAAAARQLRPGGVLLVTELCRHDQHWAHDACGDLWLGFDEAELVDWAGRAGLQLQESQFLALRNGFQVQVRSFQKRSMLIGNMQHAVRQ